MSDTTDGKQLVWVFKILLICFVSVGYYLAAYVLQVGGIEFFFLFILFNLLRFGWFTQQV